MADPFIHPHTLAARLHLPDAPAIIDMRDKDDAAADPRGIPGARRLQLAGLEGGHLPCVPTVCSCQKGGKLSQLGAAILRARGVPAVTLSGGHLAWIGQGLPTLPGKAMPDRWVMPSDASWGELTAAWVLRRLIERDVPILSVTRDWLTAAAQAWQADVMPGSATEMAARADLSHPCLVSLGGGPDFLLAGRLRRIADPDPLGAFDLIDDWLARPQRVA